MRDDSFAFSELMPECPLWVKSEHSLNGPKYDYSPNHF